MNKYLLFFSVSFFFTVCCSSEKLSHKSYQVGADYFYNSERAVLLSTWTGDTCCTNNFIEDNYGRINGFVYLRAISSNLSGELYTWSDKVDGPFVTIPTLGLTKIIKNGFFSIDIPVGIYDVLIYDRVHFPIHNVIEVDNRMECNYQFYMGGKMISTCKVAKPPF